MIRRSVSVLSLLVLAAGPLSAQAKEKDADKKVKGGKLAAGWMGRTDQASAKLADANFARVGKDYRVTSGPAAIYWHNSGKAKGAYMASATFRQLKKPTHAEAYGLVFVGKDLDTQKQDYAYLLIRGDGKFMLNHRAGEAVHKLIEWTDHPSVKKEDAKGVAVNTLSIDGSRPDSLRLKVNGVQVAALGKAYLGGGEGIVGLRVNHNLDVRVSDFSVTKK